LAWRTPVGNARIITRRWATVGITVTDITVTGGRRALDGGDGMRLHFGVLNATVTNITITAPAPA